MKQDDGEFRVALEPFVADPGGLQPSNGAQTRNWGRASSTLRACTTLTRYRPHCAGKLGSPLLRTSVMS